MPASEPFIADDELPPESLNMQFNLDFALDWEMDLEGGSPLVGGWNWRLTDAHRGHQRHGPLVARPRRPRRPDDVDGVSSLGSHDMATRGLHGDSMGTWTSVRRRGRGESAGVFPAQRSVAAAPRPQPILRSSNHHHWAPENGDSGSFPGSVLGLGLTAPATAGTGWAAGVPSHHDKVSNSPSPS